MDLNKAYATFGDVVPEVDDEMLWMAYTIGIADQPGQKDILREALQVIATHRKSQWIESRLAEETAPGTSNSMDIVPYSPPQVSHDLPAGLNNIGNTCYLNSLLQYFFSVRELREVLIRFHEFEEDIDEHEVKEKKRVGGRIVSTPEILRSKQFASQLQGLFQEMITTPLSAVTPERELAFLALVLSKDESPLHPTGNNNHNSSASTDATLVDDRSGILGPTYNPTPSPPPMATSTASSTVLGKRKSESSGSDDGHSGARNLMEVDSVKLTGEKDLSGSAEEDLVMGGATPLVTPEPQASKAAPIVIDLTDEATGLPPPLPPRPNRSRSLVAIDSGSHMMFGRQNDVSECMDNCLFQIQAALDPQKILSSGICHSAEGNLIKSLFYGKTRQSLMFDNPKGKVSIKEEQFAYLLVDVAEEGRDLYDGLDKVFDESEVEVENGKACRRVGLVELPPILQIQLQRVQFDRRTHTVFKSNAHLKFGEQLHMDRYLEPDPDDERAQEKRAKTVQLRKEIECSRGRLSELTTNLSGDKRTASTILRDLHQILSTSSDSTAPYSRAASSSSTRVEFFNGLLGQDELEFLKSEAAAIDQEIELNKLNVIRLKAEVEEMWKISEQEQQEQQPENKTKIIESSSNDNVDENKANNACASERLIAEENRIGDQQKQQLVAKDGQRSEQTNLSKDKDKDNKDGEKENLMTTDLKHNKEESILEDYSYKKQHSSATSRNAEYMLVSLFMHRGTAQGGHYWAIQRQLPERPNRWLKYNDSQVTEIDERVEVFKDQGTDQQMIENVDYSNSNTPHSTATGNDTVSDNSNPYWLTYVKVQELHRFEMLKRVVNTQKSRTVHNPNLDHSTVTSFNNHLPHHPSSDPPFIS